MNISYKITNIQFFHNINFGLDMSWYIALRNIIMRYQQIRFTGQQQNIFPRLCYSLKHCSSLKFPVNGHE